jgi:capsular polysaccharide transport system permease protein
MWRDTPFAIHVRVLFALVMREMTTRYGRSAGGYLWAVLEPAGTVALLTLVFEQIARQPPLGDSFAMFFATGYLSFHIYMDVSRTVSASVKVNRALLSFPRVTMLDTILARFLLQILTSVVVFVIVIGAVALLTGAQTRLDLRFVVLSIAMAALFGVGVGALNCVLFAFSQTWERVFGVINRPMFLISGAFFLVESLPRPIREALWWNPLIHVTSAMRRGFYPYYEASVMSPIYVLIVSLAPLMLGVLLLRVLRGRMLEG